MCKEGADILYLDSPLGPIEIMGCKGLVTSITFVETPHATTTPAPYLLDCQEQLQAYFSGQLRIFRLPLSLSGTAFEVDVYKALQAIPYGKTAAYSEIAQAIGREKACRAVGGANHKNPLSIVIPCHRVIGKNGQLVGYGGGLWRKEWLLAHEARYGLY